MVNPFDLEAALRAKHAQHVLLIHFPIALFIAAVAFDVVAIWTKRRGLADSAYYNLLAVAISTVPVLATGIYVAALTRGAEAQGHPVASPRLPLGCHDLAGLVDTLPRTTRRWRFAELSTRGGISGPRNRRADRTPGWVSQRRKRS
jgi:hypothetical protein